MRPKLFDSKIKRQFRRYFGQVALAALALFGVLWAEQLIASPDVARAIIISAVASTAFILFISPHRQVASPRHVLGGHALCMVVATLLALPMATAEGTQLAANNAALFPLVAAAAVGVAMFGMAATNTEHPPAAGTALAIATHGFNWPLVIFIGGSVLVITAVQWLVRDHLVDLY